MPQVISISDRRSQNTRVRFQNCDKIIVEVNENLIVTHGVGNYLNINQVDYIVEGGNTPMPTIGSKGAD